MAEDAGIDALISRIETRWGQAVTGTRRKHLSEILETVRTVAGEEVAADVAEWTANNPPDVPLESVRQYAASEHAVGRDRFGFR